MATQLTKAQLLSELEAVRVENQRLASENESLRTRAPKSNRRPAYVRQHSPEQEAAHSAYVRALIAAREQAARTGASVIVRRP
jgi:hypothetical protein